MKLLISLSKKTPNYSTYKHLLEDFLRYPFSENSNIIKNSSKQPKNKFTRINKDSNWTWKTQMEYLFPLFCPTREADWIPGWDCDLIYTDSGYAEKCCIFRIKKELGKDNELFIFNSFKKNHYIELVRITQQLIFQLKVILKDNKNGTITGTWQITQTALSSEENDRLAKLENNNGENLSKLIEYYLFTGECYKS